jgi:hypothetical protein
MADSDSVRLPRPLLGAIESFLIRSIRRLADTPGIEPQQLSKEGEEVLLMLASEWAMDDTRAALWPDGRPSLPSPAKANGGGA